MWQLGAALLDEGQQFTQTQVVYIMSRLRTEANMKPVMRITCNPGGKTHWLTKWVEWYLLPSGLPDPAKSGKIRYFTMRENEMVWGDSYEEVKEKVPGCTPLSFEFISANVYDNPVLMERQPEYVAWLEGQDRETKEALLYGNWYVTKQKEGYFKRKWANIIPEAPFLAKRVRAYDMAGSIKDEVNRDPDYTASVLLSKTREGRYTVEHATRMRERFHTVEQFIFKQAEIDGHDVTIVIPVDAGASGKAYASTLQKQLAEKGYHVRLHPSSTKSKLTRFRPFASVAEAGFIDVVSGDWNDWYFDELEEFIGDGKSHDDALDASVAGFWYLNQEIQLPIMELSSLSQPSNNSLPYSNIPTSQGIPQEALALPINF